jgi:hypothetical protein
VHRSFPRTGRRPRRDLAPAVRPLEDRRLLTGGPSATAVMSQTATFPDLEGHPGLSDQALLYFAATMGTLTEVDVVTSGSFTSRLSVENLGPAARTIAGTTAGDLSISVPAGAIPVAIPAVTQTFDASAFDGTLDYGGTSGRTFAPATSGSAAQTMVLTSPADLAAFTGHFRIPIGVAGHATGSTDPEDGEVSAGFATQTSATISVVYHYIPNLPSLDPPHASPGPASPPPSSPAPSGGTIAGPLPVTGDVASVGGAPAAAVTAARTRKDGGTWARTSPRPHPFHHHRVRQAGLPHRQGPDPSSVS